MLGVVTVLKECPVRADVDRDIDGDIGGISGGDADAAGGFSGGDGINRSGSADDETVRARLRHKGRPMRSPSSARHTMVSTRVVSDVARRAM